VRLVYASSSSVYGANTKTPFAEDDRTDSPNSLYAATKKANEQIAHVYHGLYGIRVVGLRFFTVYGPWGRPDMAYFSFAHKISTGRPIEVYGHGKPQRDFTFVDDVVGGIVGALACERCDEEVFNLGNHRTESLGRFIAVLEVCPVASTPRRCGVRLVSPLPSALSARADRRNSGYVQTRQRWAWRRETCSRRTRTCSVPPSASDMRLRRASTRGYDASCAGTSRPLSAYRCREARTRAFRTAYEEQRSCLCGRRRSTRKWANG
jgi:ribosome modulation factor